MSQQALSAVQKAHADLGAALTAAGNNPSAINWGTIISIIITILQTIGPLIPTAGGAPAGATAPKP